jgi:hypothetical protein
MRENNLHRIAIYSLTLAAAFSFGTFLVLVRGTVLEDFAGSDPSIAEAAAAALEPPAIINPGVYSPSDLAVFEFGAITQVDPAPLELEQGLSSEKRARILGPLVELAPGEGLYRPIGASESGPETTEQIGRAQDLQGREVSGGSSSQGAQLINFGLPATGVVQNFTPPDSSSSLVILKITRPALSADRTVLSRPNAGVGVTKGQSRDFRNQAGMDSAKRNALASSTSKLPTDEPRQLPQKVQRFPASFVSFSPTPPQQVQASNERGGRLSSGERVTRIQLPQALRPQP